jgi:hypothetical protein
VALTKGVIRASGEHKNLAAGRDRKRAKHAMEAFMKKLYTLLGIVAIGAVIGLTVFGCDTGSSSSGGGGGSNPPGQPPELPDEATKDQAIAKLNEIINHPNASAETKAAAQALKVQVEAMTGDQWTSGGAAKITAINNLVDTIPDKSTLFITNVSGLPSLSSLLILILPNGIEPSNEQELDDAVVAGANGAADHLSLDDDTLVADLYIRDTTNRWTASGTYNIYVINTYTQPPTAGKANVSFTGGAATVPLSAFEEVD